MLPSVRRDAIQVRPIFKVVLSLLLFFGLSMWLQAANETANIQQSAGNSWNNLPSIWSGNNNPAVIPGNTYQLIAGGGPSRTRNPVLGNGLVTTFAGDSLTIDPGQTIRWKGPGTPGTIMNFPGVGGNPGLICNGCFIDVGDSPMSATVRGLVQFNNNSILNSGGGADRVQIYEADVSGSGDITIQGTGSAIPYEFKSANNTYSGTWTVSVGWLKGTGTNSLGTNNITMASGTILEYNYDGKCFGTITLNGTAQMKLHSYVQTVNLSVGGSSVAAGIYSWAQLNAAYPANFPAGGSGGIRVGSAPIDAIVQDIGVNYIAWEAENKVTIINNNPATAQWSLFADPTASGGYSLIESNIAEAGNNLVSTSKWSLIFRAAGTYQMYIKYKLGANGGGTGNNSYRIPADFGPTPTMRVTRANNNPFGAPTSYVVLKEAEQNGGPDALFTVSGAMLNVPQDFVIGNRECPGFSIDRIILSQDTTIPQNTDTGTFDALINSSGGSQLLPAPRVLSVDSRLNPNGLQVKFANPVNATALNPANYTLDNGVTVSGAVYADGQPNSNIVQLTTTALTPYTTYTVTIANVQNLQNLVQDPNPTNLTFVHYGTLNQPQGLTMKRYDGSGDFNVIKSKIATCVVPSRMDTNIATMEYGTNPSRNNTAGDPNTENYGTWLYGMFAPPTTGNYVFGFNADDNAELWLSTDTSPANRVLITSQPSWGGSREYNPPGNNNVPPLSKPIPLVAGRLYYMEALHQEGGGGDHVEVAVQKPGDPAIVNGDAAIPRSLFTPTYSVGCPPTGFFTVLGPVVQTVAPASQTV